MRTAPMNPISPNFHALTRLAPFFRLLTLLVVIAVVALSVQQAQAAKAAPDSGFQSFVQSLWPQAQARNVSRATFDAAFEGVTPNPKLIALTKKQAEFVKPVWDYLAGAVSAKRIGRGQEKRAEWKDTLARAQSQYGVDPSVVMGIWGMETDFGGFSGDNNVIRSLATLAYARYRGDFFKDELLNALQILQEGHIAPAAMTGSWAGAMGQTQFMPSSFLKYAVDFNRDGRKDIWTSVPDALGSTANYLKRSGWSSGRPWGFEVKLPAGYSGPSGRTNKQPMASWASRGITRIDGRALGDESAGLLIPAGATGPAFLVTHNFDAIYAYNAAESYALAIALLSDRLRGGAGMATPWPNGERGLSRVERRELQGLLKTRGYDIGNADGVLGTKSRQAISDFQTRTGLTANGSASGRVLDALRKGQ